MKLVSLVAQPLKIEIYGIQDNPGCRQVMKIMDNASLPYEFNRVILEGPDGPIYDKPLIISLAKRLKQFPSLAIHYPVIFINDNHVHYSHLALVLSKLGKLID